MKPYRSAAYTSPSTRVYRPTARPPRTSYGTRGMTATLRDRARVLIAERYGDDPDTADILNKVLDDAEEATTQRNRLLHSVWMAMPGEGPVLYDRDSMLKTHVLYRLPTVEDLMSICAQIARIHRVLNHLTRRLL